MKYLITKEQVGLLKKVVANAVIGHFKGDLPDIIAADKLLKGLLEQPEGEPVKLPSWRGICHPEGTLHLTQNIFMNAHQLRNALDFVNPDGANDTDQLESELTIQWRKEAVFEGENYPAGLYANFTDYPEEGSILLDADKSAITHPSPTQVPLTDEQWMLVSEGMPPNGSIVYVYSKHGQTDLADVTDGAFKSCWMIDDPDETITHWMHRPKPPMHCIGVKA